MASSAALGGDEQVNATFWLGIAGIAGTLSGALLGPVLSERMRRNSVRAEQYSAQRLVVHADLLRVAARFADNAQTWAVNPLEELAENEPEELDRLFSQVRVIATSRVCGQCKSLERTVLAFNRQLLEAQPHHRRLRELADSGQGSGQDGLAVTQRTNLDTAAEGVREAYGQLSRAVRREMQP
ncbi:hypothetical protein ACOT81_04420 [Streptomyces sp. WI04-05B]|uniref:hypothetical protein n=1 Tax=Streptomyces TaxID=1883 RepID=UPI0029BEDDEE|nr:MULTISPECIES: hypothetical protein [unclassified Streptomyces]MDX2547743.1 hypothetical protein [Streptomyces sp. WI04-05B]MDX2590056.1 hypothetical protein [Streptomyces sp. WI04-05A]